MQSLLETLKSEQIRLLNIYATAPEGDLKQLDAKITKIGQEIKWLEKNGGN